MSQLNFNVSGNPVDDIPVLIADNPPGGTTLLTRFEGVPGESPNRFVAIVPPEITGGATLFYQSSKKSFRVIVPPGTGSWEAGLPPCIPPEYLGDSSRVCLSYTQTWFSLPTLEPRGRFFWKSGARFFLNGATAFNLYNRFLVEGAEAIRPFLSQRESLGFNALRVWTAYDIPMIGRLIPREHPDFYDRVDEFESLCAEYSQYVYWTVYAGANSSTLGTVTQMIEHQLRLQDTLASWSLLDLHNEKNHPANFPSDFTGPNPDSSILWSQGSNIQDDESPTPYGRFAGRHPGSSEWQRKTGKQAWDDQNLLNLNIPFVDDETVRVEPGGETNVEHCFDAAACGAMFIAGAMFHSREAKLATPFTGAELSCADAWCRGVRSVPLQITQDGTYSRVDDAAYLRVYLKTLPGVGTHSLQIRF